MPKATAQSFLELDQIREGVIILKSKALRAILMVSSLNFALKSEDEQGAIVYQFQDFLNSLDFSVQIIVQSRKLNITGYLETLEGLEKEQESDLMRVQTAEYRKFIEELVQGETIMSKSFYVIVPFSPIDIQEAQMGGILKKPKKILSLTEEDFQRAKVQLWQRMEFVALGLRRCGLQAVPLTTPELIELFWTLYHPKEAEIGYYPEVPPELIT